MRHSKALLVVALCLTATIRTFAAETVPIVEVGSTTLRAESGKRTIDVSITTEKRRAAMYEDEDDSTAPQRSVVRTIVITVNGQKVFVPGLVLYGLVSPPRAELTVGPEISVLTIRGGDTSAAYIGKIEFDGQRVRRMTRASSLMPDKPLVVTTFSVGQLEDRQLKAR